MTKDFIQMLFDRLHEDIDSYVALRQQYIFLSMQIAHAYERAALLRSFLEHEGVSPLPEMPPKYPLSRAAQRRAEAQSGEPARTVQPSNDKNARNPTTDTEVVLSAEEWERERTCKKCGHRSADPVEAVMHADDCTVARSEGTRE